MLRRSWVQGRTALGRVREVEPLGVGRRKGGVVPTGVVGWSLWMLVLLRDCGLMQCVAWGLPPRTPSENPVKGTARPVVSGGRPLEP